MKTLRERERERDRERERINVHLQPLSVRSLAWQLEKEESERDNHNGKCTIQQYLFECCVGSQQADDGR